MGYEKYLKDVSGKNMGRIVLFAISTCQWCRKTKNLLGELRAAYKYVDVDLLEGDALELVAQEMDKLNPRSSFPTLVIDGKCFIGFQEEDIRRELANGK